MPGYFCYIAECADGTYYTGLTTDPERRIREHNAGQGGRYTRTRRPVRLAYVESQPDRQSAMRRERALKALSRARKTALIDGAPAAHDPPRLPRRKSDGRNRRR